MNVGINYYFWQSVTDAQLERDMAMFQGHGLKFLSIRMIWQALEPQVGQYSNTMLSSVRRTLSAAAQHDLNVQVDFHTFTPTTSMVPSGMSTDTTKMATDLAYRQVYLDMIEYYVTNLHDYPKHSYSVLNEAGRQEYRETVLAGWEDYYMDAAVVVRSIETVPVTFRMSLPDSWRSTGTKKFSATKYFDVLDYLCINHYLDGRDPNSRAWACDWESVREMAEDAHDHGVECWVTEWGGIASPHGPVKTPEFYRATLTMMEELGVDCANAYNYSPGTGDSWNIRGYPELFDVMQEFAEEAPPPPPEMPESAEATTNLETGVIYYRVEDGDWIRLPGCSKHLVYEQYYEPPMLIMTVIGCRDQPYLWDGYVDVVSGDFSGWVRGDLYKPPPVPMGCTFNAATEGTVFSPYLWNLRKFRDRCLPKDITAFYYKHSPRFAKLIRRLRNAEEAA